MAIGVKFHARSTSRNVFGVIFVLLTSQQIIFGVARTEISPLTAFTFKCVSRTRNYCFIQEYRHDKGFENYGSSSLNQQSNVALYGPQSTAMNDTFRSKKNTSFLHEKGLSKLEMNRPDTLEGDSSTASSSSKTPEDLMSLLEVLQPNFKNTDPRSHDAYQMSPNAWAYIGDVIFELFIRVRYVYPDRRTSDLQTIVTSVVRGKK